MISPLAHSDYTKSLYYVQVSSLACYIEEGKCEGGTAIQLWYKGLNVLKTSLKHTLLTIPEDNCSDLVTPTKRRQKHT
jgi:hypothetical protein